MKTLFAIALLGTVTFAVTTACGGKKKCECTCVCDGATMMIPDLEDNDQCIASCEASCVGGSWSADSTCKK